VSYKDNILTIKTTEENNTIIPKVLYTAPIVDKAYIEANGDDALYLKPIGTGPYKVSEFIPGTSVSMETWDGYPFTKPQIDKITFTAIAEDANRYIAVETGQVQYAGLVSAMEKDLAVKNNDLSTYEVASKRTLVFVFNTEKPPLDNVNIRRALSYALDRDSFCALLGGRTPAESPLFGGFDGWYTVPSTLPQYDLDKAKELLAAEGYSTSNPLKLELNYFLPDPGLELYQSALKSIGVDLVLNQIEFSVFLSKEAPGDFDIEWSSQLQRGGTMLTDLDRFDYDFLGTRDTCRYYNEDYQNIVAQMRVTTDQQELKDLAAQANEIIGQDVPMLAVYMYPIISVMDKGLSGVTIRGDMMQSFRNATYNG
jgi:peptide/nickel transport system substrate-binding protein